MSSLDSPLETFPAEETLKMAILSSVGSIQDGKESVAQYEEISSSLNLEIYKKIYYSISNIEKNRIFFSLL